MTGPARIPLISGSDPERVVVWQKGRPVTQTALLCAAERLAEELPERRHVFNACGSRYGFMVAFMAALRRGQTTVLPNDRTPRVAARMRDRFDDLYCLSDETADFAGFETWQVDTEIPRDPASPDTPSLPGQHIAAIAFTSGSTGEPEPNEKSVDVLATTGRFIAERFGLDQDRRATVVATVPAQHMYGLETSIAMPLWSRVAVSSSRPLYPADIVSALSEVPAPRILVTTPLHLNSLLKSSVVLPALDSVISATAPLSAETARQIEERFDTAVSEIYGFSEAGTVATRRTATSRLWRTCSGLTLRQRGSTNFVEAAHFPAPVPMTDIVEIISPQEFELQGRASDTINIAGKRASMNGLNTILTGIEGVADGTFFLADEVPQGSVTRLVAFVVAPEGSLPAIREALRSSIDPAFMPRQIFRLPSLPRLETGKLPQAALAELMARLKADQA